MVTEPNQLRQQYGGIIIIRRRCIEMLISAEKTIDAWILKGVCANMLNIALTPWLWMSNVLTSHRPCSI